MNSDNGLKNIKLEEDKILKEAEKIEEAEKRIKEEEKKILSSEEEILKSSKNKKSGVFDVDEGLTQRELQIFRLLFIKKLTKHKLISALVVIIATVLIWRGIWHTADDIPILSYSLVSLGVGILLLWILKKYTDLL
ncbi:MAG: hypothetical protein Q7R49_00515 [Candidatus Daviesbacteria bacterium]|nr:hypothetical protein [Candidatus Daviesbacteria bacterium]